MRRLQLITIGAIVACSALSGCESATQITVVITADSTVCTPQLDTELSVGSLAQVSAGRPPAATAQGCAGGQVGSVVLVPSSGDGSEVAFRVLASITGATDCATSFGPDCIEATRALRYLPHTPLTMLVPLRASCEGVVCAEGTTCVSGACVSATVDPSQCQGSGGCGEGALGPSPSPADGGADATVADASDEATVSDAGVDANDATISDAALDTSVGDVDTGAGADGAPDAADAALDADVDASPGILLALGTEASCALLPDGTVQCWGGDAFGELGIGDAGADTGALPPARVAGLSGPLRSIAGGESARHACALSGDGGLFCWGANDFGQLGVPTDGGTSGVPVIVPGAPPLSMLSLGAYQTCGATDLGSEVTCWGNWGGGVTGVGAIVPSTVVPIVSVASAGQVGCEATGDAGVFCWGYDVTYVEDGGTTSVAAAPQGTEGAVEVQIGYAALCARLADGAVTCWGTNGFGELGFPSDGLAHGPTPIALPSGRAATHLAVGEQHVCAILDDATVACWGQNDAHQCGPDAVGGEQDAPVSVRGVAGATSIAAGANHTCAVVGGTRVECWGDNSSGQLGTPGEFNGEPQLVTFAP
jgi:hypothetical protein